MGVSNAFFSHVDYGDGIYAITAPLGEQMYLILGGRQAALIDTGMGIGSLRDYVAQLTSLPVVVINTHGHPDHAGGNLEFKTCYLHPADQKWYLSMCHQNYRRDDIRKLCPDRYREYSDALLADAPIPLPIEHGVQLDLGGRSLLTFLAPGHTPGSICLYDEATDSLFAGDTFSAENVWLYGEYSEPLNTYYHTLLQLQQAFPEVSWCFVGHKPARLNRAVIQTAQVCARRILMHDAKGQPVKTFAGEGCLYQYGDYKIIYNPSHLY